MTENPFHITPLKLEGIHPSESSKRAPKIFRVWLETTILAVYCHDVAYQGGFASFWVVHEGVKKTIWSTNQRIDIKEVEATLKYAVGFGVYTYPHWGNWDPHKDY